jgi:hypothetical protein
VLGTVVGKVDGPGVGSIEGKVVGRWDGTFEEINGAGETVGSAVGY